MAGLSHRWWGWVLVLALGSTTADAGEAQPPIRPARQLQVVVRRAVDSTAVRGARVALIEPALASDTDAQGRARFERLADDRVTARVTADGFLPIEIPVQLSTAETLVEVLLSPAVLRHDESLIVAADRLERIDASTPRSTTVIGRTTLDERAARTAPEALQDQSGGWVQKTNHGGGSPFLRGLVGNQVLVLIDGIRLNNATFRLGPNQYMNTIDAFSLERIEVVRGSGSVAYGSDALGGVVNLVTAKPALSPSRVVAGGAVSTRLAGRGMEASARVDAFVSGPRAAVRGGVTYRAFGDLVAGGLLGVEAPSAYDEADADASLLWAPTQATRVSAVFQNVHQFDVPRYDQVAQRGYAVYAFDPQIRRLGYVDVEQRVGTRGIDAVRLTASWHRSEEGRVRRRQGSSIETREEDVVSTLGVSGSVRGRAAPWLSWSGGLEAYDDVVRSWRRDTNLATGASIPLRGLYPDGATRFSFAAFAMGVLSAGRTSVELGARYSRDEVRADDPVFGPTSISPDNVVTSAAIGYAAAPWLSVFGSASQAFRAPNIDDLSTLGVFDFGIEVPPVSLAPERSLAFEGGVKVLASRVSASASVYRLNLQDLIDRERITVQGAETLEGQDIYRRANIGQAYVRGVEANVEWKVNTGLSISGFVATTYGRQAAADIPLRRIPPANGQIAARFEWPKGVWVETNLRAARIQDRLAPGDLADHRIPPGGTPGWVVANLMAGVPLGRLVVTGGVANLFDASYRVHGSGIDGAGRHVWLGVRVGF
jgi:outer membrane receptor protein involved in Fe transport